MTTAANTPAPAHAQVAAFLAGMEFGATKPRANRRHVRQVARQRYNHPQVAEAFRQAVRAIRFASEPITLHAASA